MPGAEGASATRETLRQKDPDHETTWTNRSIGSLHAAFADRTEQGRPGHRPVRPFFVTAPPAWHTARSPESTVRVRGSFERVTPSQP